MPPRQWVWRHFAFQLPTDWEMLKFSRDPDRGRCAFADRHAFRFELNWRAVPAPPDVDRMLSDYRARLLDAGMTDDHLTRNGKWRGLRGRMDPGVISRHGAHFAGQGCLVELVFIWPDQHDDAFEQTTLNGFVEHPVTPDGLARWRAFGMDLCVDADLTFTACHAKPADVDMRFANERKRVEHRFRRQGMLADWMKTRPAAWLSESVAETTTSPVHVDPLVVNGHNIARVRLDLPRGGVRRKRVREAEAWICPEDGRLYHWVVTRPARDRPGTRRLRPLTCCDRLRSQATL